jgi:hypothetical protein
MKYLKIQNKGELDIRLVSLMGGTTKANKAHLIGNFGSGLKYTLSYLLRNNLSFKIFIGEHEVGITTKNEVIRDESFDIIYIDGERSSITANMGRDWSAWMIIRELWSNALDEGDAIKEEVTDLSGQAGCTTFFIQVDKEIREVIDNWQHYFIQSIPKIGCNMYKGGQSLCLYKQGVLIHEDTHSRGVFNYEIPEATLNELREFKDSISHAIFSSLANCQDQKVIEYFLQNIKPDHYESTMDYGWSWIHYSKAWEDVLSGVKIIYPEALEKLVSMGKDIDKMSYIVVPEKLFHSLTAQFPSVGAIKVIKNNGEFYEDYNEKTEQKLKESLAILESCDYYLAEGIEFRYGLFENRNVLARIDIKEKIIYVSNSMFQKPLHSVVSMLIEENEHYLTGYEDHTREFQQHFIDLYTRQLLSANEIEI